MSGILNITSRCLRSPTVHVSKHWGRGARPARNHLAQCAGLSLRRILRPRSSAKDMGCVLRSDQAEADAEHSGISVE